MKKFIIILAALVALFASCTKEAISPEPEMVNVTFDYKMVESNSMVRSATDDQIVSAIKSLLPTSITFTAKSSAGVSYKITTGSSVALPLDTYYIDYRYEVGSNYSGYEVPSFKIQQSVTVSKVTSSITLSAEYECYAIVVDKNEVKSLTSKNVNMAYSSSTYKEVSGFLMTFMSPPSMFTWTLFVDDSSEFIQTSVNTTMGYESDAIKVEYGKYYFLHPEKVGKVTTSSSVSYPDWVSGGSNI